MKKLLALAAAAALALTMAPSALAHGTTVVRPSAPGGFDFTPWPDNSGVHADFERGPATSGIGSYQFGPLSSTTAASKAIINRDEEVDAADYDAIAYDFYDPAGGNAHQFYLNVYSKNPSNPGTSWFDCRLDYVPATGAAGWNTFSIDDTTTATAVSDRSSSTSNCATTIGGLPAGSVIFRVAFNGGDTSLSDAGLEGGFDTIVLTQGGHAKAYDLEPDLTKDDCKKGGWASVSRNDGSSFNNQGDCIQYVNTGK